MKNSPIGRMLAIIFLLSIVFTLLRSVRSTLVVVDLGCGAHQIPLFELFSLPASLGMTWLMTKVLARSSWERIFFVSMVGVLSFFLVFALWIYPLLMQFKAQSTHAFLVTMCAMLFYIVAELWKPAFMVILFWGFLNQHMPTMVAKKTYGPLMLAASLGAALAGPLIWVCRQCAVSYPLMSSIWGATLIWVILAIGMCGMVTVYLYYGLARDLSSTFAAPASKRIELSSSITLCAQNLPLRLLAWIVIADYIAYSLGEVIFLDVLKRVFPQPSDYCQYMGWLASCGSLVTVGVACCVAPYVLRKGSWVMAAAVTPICLLVTESLFFLTLCGREYGEMWISQEKWLAALVVIGSVQYCICRATKYTFFDASKELAFVLMPQEYRIQGKLVVDGVCARTGRAGASILSLVFIRLFGGVLASARITGLVAVGMAVGWILGVFRLGSLIERQHMVQEPSNMES